MIKIENHIKLDLKRKHSDFETLIKALLKRNNKFIYEIVSEELVVLTFNPTYRSFWIHSGSSARGVKGILTSEALNNVNPTIKIEKEAIPNYLLFVIASISTILIATLLTRDQYFGCLITLGVAVLLITIVYIINKFGVAQFAGELSDEIER